MRDMHSILAMTEHGALASLNEGTREVEVEQLKTEIEYLRSANAHYMADMAIEIQHERTRTAEALAARDATIQRLSDAYVSLLQKSELIERYEYEWKRQNPGAITLTERTAMECSVMAEHARGLQNTIVDMSREMDRLKATVSSPLQAIDPSPSYEETPAKRPELLTIYSSNSLGSSPHASRGPTPIPSPNTAVFFDPDITLQDPPLDGSIGSIETRFSILADVPLPAESSDETLKAIVIPTPLTLQEFLGAASPTLKAALGAYRILNSVTARWCPEREEHGFYYTPMFKCTTNPRVMTAHCWNIVDPIGALSKPTECFYNKEGLWYYAGSYQGFRMDDLSLKEWQELSLETSQAIVKETVSGRKNTSPSNIYEVSQLYSCGALKVACIGLQCVGFNQEVYKAVLEQSSKFVRNKWEALVAVGVSLPSQAVLSSIVRDTPSPQPPSLQISRSSSRAAKTPSPSARASSAAGQVGGRRTPLATQNTNAAAGAHVDRVVSGTKEDRRNNNKVPAPIGTGRVKKRHE